MNLEEALCAIAGGDERAFLWLYNSAQPRLLGYATGILAGDRAAAEDVVDEAFMAVWQQAGRYSASGSAEGWLRRIVRNKVVDHLRRTHSARHCDLADDQLERIADAAAGPDRIAEKNSARDELARALARLSPDHREAVWLCYFEELPLSEIAQQVGCPENTVKTRLFHARKALRSILAPHA